MLGRRAGRVWLSRWPPEVWRRVCQSCGIGSGVPRAQRGRPVVEGWGKVGVVAGMLRARSIQVDVGVFCSAAFRDCGVVTVGMVTPGKPGAIWRKVLPARRRAGASGAWIRMLIGGGEATEGALLAWGR